MTVITMSRTEIDRMSVLHDLADGRIKIAEASTLMGLGRRQVRRRIDQRERHRFARQYGELADRRQLGRETRLLSELNEWLQSCNSLGELYDMVAQFLSKLLPHCAGTLYVYANSRDVLESAKAWNGGKLKPAMHPEDCWGLRRGRTYAYGENEIDFCRLRRSPHRACQFDRFLCRVPCKRRRILDYRWSGWKGPQGQILETVSENGADFADLMRVPRRNENDGATLVPGWQGGGMVSCWQRHDKSRRV